MAKKPAKVAHGSKSKTQDKKTKECWVCGGTMDWCKVANKGGKSMTFVCSKCGQVE